MDMKKIMQRLLRFQRRTLNIIITLSFILWSSRSFSADLVEVYCQALKCDPTFNAAMAILMANRENIPINRASLLPRLDIHADVERQRVKFQGLSAKALRTTDIFIPTAESVTFYNNHVDYYLKLTQPIFNYTNWAKLQQAKASVKAAEATFCASAQDLMVRVVRAYFDVLIAHADLLYTREYKKAVGEQLRINRIEFKVGTVPITNVLEAEAAYDLVISQEITDQYTLAQRVEALRAITNNLYCSLEGLSTYLPHITPHPCGIQSWVCTAERQNYDLLAARYDSIAARENIKVQEGGGLPVVNSFGKYSYEYDSNNLGTDVLRRQQILAGGLELDWAPIQGGGVIARTRQAIYQMREACHNQEFIHQQVISDTRNAYLGIFSNMSKVRADFASITSNQQSVKATIESFRVGTRTILDVLNVEAQLYDVQKQFVRDRYEYIYQTILLKQATGTLSVCDLQYINIWLYSHVNISKTDALLTGCVCASTH